MPCELEDSTFADELEETLGIDEELDATAEDELCGALEEELVAVSEELDVSEELEAGVSFLATPFAANSGA